MAAWDWTPCGRRRPSRWGWRWAYGSFARRELSDHAREGHQQSFAGDDLAAHEDQALAGLGHLARRLDQFADISAVDKGRIQLHRHARGAFHLLIGDLEHGDVGEGHQAAAVHPSAEIHVLLLGAEGATHGAVGIRGPRWSRRWRRRPHRSPTPRTRLR